MQHYTELWRRKRRKNEEEEEEERETGKKSPEVTLPLLRGAGYWKKVHL